MSLLKVLFLVFFFIGAVWAENVVVRGYGIAKASMDNPRQQAETAKMAAKTTAQRDLVLLKGAKLIVKGSSFELDTQGKPPKYSKSAFRKISNLYWECGLSLNADRYTAGKTVKNISFTLMYYADLDFSDFNSIKSYNDFVNAGILQQLGEEILKQNPALSGKSEINLKYLYIDKKAGQKEIPVKVFYSL